jgi:(2Fe-2S) ferredoxin
VTRPLCSVLADAAGDAREGTAPPAEQWFLVEHPGPWPRVAHSDLPEAAALDAWARAARGRVLMIRRPGRPVPGAPRRWFRVDSRPGREQIVTGPVDGPLDPSAAGEPHPGPLHLVCAHGRHDTCCAVRGRPLAAALAEAVPESAWECSHLGGCRFAPALVLLPHGIVLGGVPAADVARVVADHAAGLVVPELVRGRSAVPPAAQAAQHHARLATGARGVDDLRVVSVTAPAPGRWRVELADPDVVVDLTEQSVAAGRHLTCAAPGPGRMRTFTLVALSPSAAPVLPHPA